MISGVHVIPIIITCTLQGMFCDTGIPLTFYGGKICSVQLYFTWLVPIMYWKPLASLFTPCWPDPTTNSEFSWSFKWSYSFWWKTKTNLLGESGKIGHSEGSVRTDSYVDWTTLRSLRSSASFINNWLVEQARTHTVGWNHNKKKVSQDVTGTTRCTSGHNFDLNSTKGMFKSVRL